MRCHRFLPLDHDVLALYLMYVGVVEACAAQHVGQEVKHIPHADVSGDDNVEASICKAGVGGKREAAAGARTVLDRGEQGGTAVEGRAIHRDVDPLAL